jgi:hypothetical protein
MPKFTTQVLHSLAESISQNNYKVTLYNVRKDLQINLKEANYLIISMVENIWNVIKKDYFF